MTPKQFSGTYCYPILFFVFNYPFSNGIHQIMFISILNFAASVAVTVSIAYSNLRRYVAHTRYFETGYAHTNGQRNPAIILSLVSM